MRPWLAVLLGSVACSPEVVVKATFPEDTSVGGRGPRGQGIVEKGASVGAAVEEARAAAEARAVEEARAAAEARAVEEARAAARAAGGWFCATATGSLHVTTEFLPVSHCSRTPAGCEDLRRSAYRQSVVTDACHAQQTAACFTFVDRLEQAKRKICAARFSHCAELRTRQQQQKLDVSDVSDCRPVK